MKLIACVLLFLTFPPVILRAENLLIHVHLLKGVCTDDHYLIREPNILHTYAVPGADSVRLSLNRSLAEFLGATKSVLSRTYKLDSLESLVSFCVICDSKKRVLDEIIIQPPEVYRFEFTVAWPSLSFISVNFHISAKEYVVPLKSRNLEDWQKDHPKVGSSRLDRGVFENILDQTTTLAVADPVIIAFPFQGQTYFMVACALDRPQPIKMVSPAYPGAIRRQELRGEGLYRISIDDKGAVIEARVLRSVHPYLDLAAIRALKQWLFAPVLKNGKAIPVSFNWTIGFSPELVSKHPNDVVYEEYSDQLAGILDHCSDYCQNLADASEGFVCEESLTEYVYDVSANPYGGRSRGYVRNVEAQGAERVAEKVGEGLPSVKRPSQKSSITRYICDCQYIKKGGQLKKRLIVMKQNRRLQEGENKAIEEKRYLDISPMTAPLAVLSRSARPLYKFRFLNDAKAHGKAAYLIEASPNAGNSAEVERARVWVDKEQYQVLRLEVYGIPAEGYEFLLEDASSFGLDPNFITTYEYKVEQDGFLFPSGLHIHVEYPWDRVWGMSAITKLDTEVGYSKYRFFRVKTEYEIKD